MIRLCDFEPSDRERLDWIFKLDELLGDNAVQFNKPNGMVVMSKCALDEFLFDVADEFVSALELQRDGSLQLRWKDLIACTFRSLKDSGFVRPKRRDLQPAPF